MVGAAGNTKSPWSRRKSVIAAMNPERYEVIRYLIAKDGRWNPGPILPEPGANPGIDVVFPVLHGTFGEDGTMQGLFELADLPYVGANVLASAVSMDKDVMKRLCRDRGLPIVEYTVVSRDEIEADAVAREFPFPMFVKPANLGSSVGISKAHDCAELEDRAEGWRPNTIARFWWSAVSKGASSSARCSATSDPEASMPCEILPSREFYDYEDKYELNLARTVLPPDLPEDEIVEMRRLAVECYKAVGCEGMGRVDFLRETATGKLYINEINTVPGFTSISMFPKMWEYSGIPYRELDRPTDRTCARSARGEEGDPVHEIIVTNAKVVQD